MGFALLAGLSALAALAALAVTVRAELRGRAELLVAATVLWNFIVIAPIYVLGLAGKLYPRSLAVASALTSVATFLIAARGTGLRMLLSRSGRAAAELARLPGRVLALTWRARSMVFVGAAFAAILLPYLALSSYLAQQLPHWDPLWYHDTIVGFTIQNHGMAMVDLPPTLQKVNGYPRVAEMTQLWLVIFADRRLADGANLLFAPALIASSYALARRHAGVVIAVGWGLANALMLACLNLFHSTYVDPQSAALLLAGILFATVDPPRLRDTWLAAVGLTLAIGAKGLALAPVPVAGLIAAVLVLRAHPAPRRRAAILTVAGGAALIAAMASVTYLRNYLAFHNPFWPDLRIDVQALGIHWPSDAAHPQGTLDLNVPFLTLVEHLFVLPWSVRGVKLEEMIDYGIGIEWIAIPLGAVAFVACFVIAIRSRLGRGVVTAVPASDRPPVPLAIILASMVAGSPALWAARYHIAAVGLIGALCAWLTGRPPRDRLGESAVAAVLVTSVMMFWWTPPPRWWYTPAQLVAHLRASPLEREVDRGLGAPTLRAVGLARERELGPGSLVVFNERFSGFPSLFWNNTYSNRIMYLRGGPDFLTRAAAAGASWVFLNDRDALVAAARRPGSGWEEVGVLNPINGGSAFRRKAPAPAQPAGLTPSEPR